LLRPAAVKIEATEEVAQLLLAGLWRQPGQVQQRAGLGVETVELVLGEITDRQVFAGFQLAGDQWQRPGQGLDQGRLAGTIGAEYADARARRQLQLDVLQDRLAVITQRAFAQIQQRV